MKTIFVGCLRLLLFLALTELIPPLGAWGAETPADDSRFTTVLIRVNGNGTVTPNYEGRRLRINSFIYPHVQPAAGHLFAGWTGSSTCYVCNVFTVVPGLELTANFVPNPFPVVAGTYHGLCFETNGARPESSASFTLTLGSQGGLTARFNHGNHTYTVGGRGYREPVHPDGTVTLGFYRGDPIDGGFHQVMTAELQFDLTNGTEQATGTLSDGHWTLGKIPNLWVPSTWTAPISGWRMIETSRKNPAPQAGTYTLILPGGSGTNAPAGTGFATVRVDRSGFVQTTGFLADGRSFSHRTGLSRDGRWPLFVGGYGHEGACLGWLRFEARPDDDLHGSMNWIVLPKTNRVMYPDGFVSILEAVGSRYQRPLEAKAPILGFTNGIATFRAGGLDADLTHDFSLSGTKATTAQTNRLSLSFLPSTGLFKGKFTPAQDTRSIAFKGAVIQRQNFAAGYFLRSNLSGSITLAPVRP